MKMTCQMIAGLEFAGLSDSAFDSAVVDFSDILGLRRRRGARHGVRARAESPSMAALRRLRRRSVERRTVPLRSAHPDPAAAVRNLASPPRRAGRVGHPRAASPGVVALGYIR